MNTPSGTSGDNTDKIMLFHMWGKYRESLLRKNVTSKQITQEQLKNLTHKQAKNIIHAAMGKPTRRINMHTLDALRLYWQRVEKFAEQANHELKNEQSHGTLIDHSNSGEDEESSQEPILESTDQNSGAIDYDHPQGNAQAREWMAKAMSTWYKSYITPEQLLFTVGGAGAIRVIFETFNKRYEENPGYRVITPFPYYTLYADNPSHRLHPIEVMNEPGYRLTARSIEASIESAYKLAQLDNGFPKAILICNPNNPLGTVIDQDEMQKIAEVLRRYPDLHIVFDEAYAEMSFVDMPSLLTIAPDLKERTIIMRSATKGQSAAGERMAVILGFDKTLMGEMLDQNIRLCGHPPVSLQVAYAYTMKKFVGDKTEQQGLKDFYKVKSDYVTERLQRMGASMPDPDYQADGSFYALANFSDMFGLAIPADAKMALGETKTGKVSNDEELAYSLLFRDSLMIAPLSYYGLPKENGFMRITCSGKQAELTNLMDRLENRLLLARQERKTQLLDKISVQLGEIDEKHYQFYIQKLSSLVVPKKDCLSLKAQIEDLKAIHSTLKAQVQEQSPEGKIKAALVIQSFFRGSKVRKDWKLNPLITKEWSSFVDTLFKEPCRMKTLFLGLSPSERLNVEGWEKHLNKRGIALLNQDSANSNGPRPNG